MTAAAPTPFFDAAPVNPATVGVDAAAPVPVALGRTLPVALATTLLRVAASLATDAADAEAAGLRGSAALQ